MPLAMPLADKAERIRRSIDSKFVAEELEEWPEVCQIPARAGMDLFFQLRSMSSVPSIRIEQVKEELEKARIELDRSVTRYASVKTHGLDAMEDVEVTIPGSHTAIPLTQLRKTLTCLRNRVSNDRAIVGGLERELARLAAEVPFAEEQLTFL